MDPFEYHRLGLRTFNPPKAARRQVRLEVYLPLGLSVLMLVTGGVLLRRAGVGNASVWADVGLALLLGMGFVLGLLILVIVAAAAAGVWYLVRFLPAPFMEARIGLAKARQAALQASDRAARAVILPSAGLRAVRAALSYLASILQR
ncbi:MAG: hypothetical protein ACRDHG_11340 [Anaerolineales bacterium]